ncbi:thioredoxin, putative [Theileria annulata]|uniref:Thioredoxin n=1 Tax=Theileria annulata TaxID=5874 RepID=Q4UA88_THEAN|nr:thioredoxin, putative [Theileria annulata]CAI76265.1 thioredoxin, putative [Theileria annulata]|eukprot:XP_952889.1 thioredoxin, putative [Theileria annulata]
MVHEVTSKEEFDKTLSGDSVVVVDFYANWCGMFLYINFNKLLVTVLLGPCMRFAPQFEELAKEHPNLVFVKVNVDNLQELAQKYNVTSLPTFKVFKSGQVQGEFLGANKDGLKFV